MNSTSHHVDWVAGADACRAGWFVVLRNIRTDETRSRRVPDADSLLSLEEAPCIIAVDMVIGIPEEAVEGGRDCDRAARSLLGWPKSSSVFSPPSRSALSAPSYQEALERNRASGTDRVGLSKQTYNLIPKMHALDEALRSRDSVQDVYEVHPECSFCEMNGGQPVEASKHTSKGEQERMLLLAEHGFSNVQGAVTMHRSGEIQTNDILDAFAAAWTATRIYRGTARRLPEDTELPRDATGLPMAIWL